MEGLNFLKDFVDFVNNPIGDNKLDRLENYLIQLYDFCLKIEIRQGKDLKTRSNYNELREVVNKNFGELGHYNDVLEIKDNLGRTELIKGDTIDDLTDILKDLTNALKHKKEKDVLATVKVDFEFHTKSHIINLLRFIASDI
ncbi:DUF5063 domain-containing protein [Muricauda sp. JGD-17]|uniref:DUF5063 domain-containing protein n=1 Tax=Flagellimonas ochracea TaxID=2696472 RepID=A0A964WYY6_9FLAO|nr:DUF5063 domain-containing protein [Allomuricauda ochracea]NAY93457.1 DUF5063 domain-containing protein [Allomuricauda ochracea]